MYKSSNNNYIYNTITNGLSPMIVANAVSFLMKAIFVPDLGSSISPSMIERRCLFLRVNTWATVVVWFKRRSAVNQLLIVHTRLRLILQLADPCIVEQRRIRIQHRVVRKRRLSRAARVALRTPRFIWIYRVHWEERSVEILSYLLPHVVYIL